jgi:putative FmdB family regulatory protein
MPRYTYHCEECDESFELSHGIKETPELVCDCGVSLIKVPTTFLSLEKKKFKKATGDLVRTSINEFRKDLRQQQKEAADKEM